MVILPLEVITGPFDDGGEGGALEWANISFLDMLVLLSRLKALVEVVPALRVTIVCTVGPLGRRPLRKCTGVPWSYLFAKGRSNDTGKVFLVQEKVMLLLPWLKWFMKWELD